MADFARWVTAAAPALGWKARAFLDAYAQNRDEAHAVAVEGSGVAQAVYTLVRTATSWKGTATELLVALKAQRPFTVARSSGLPTMLVPSVQRSVAWRPACARWASR